MRGLHVVHRSRRRAPRPGTLFKPDRPRAIDRYIDYFGGAADADPCGELLLACLATDDESEAANPALRPASNG